jgi:hypothetical protein
VIEEARALLQGAAPAATSAGRVKVPAWVGVNRLAHASPAELVEMAQSGCRHRGSSWDQACGFLAGEVLAAASRPEAIAEVQRVLVGLELELLDGGRAAVSPAELVRVVCAAVRSHRFGPPNR